MKFEIKSRWNGSVLFECEAATLRLAMEAAVEKRVNLKGADLKGAYLEGADLKGAYLKGADLKGAYLKGADLKGAYLKGADLEGADLEGADLKGAYLDDIKKDFFKVLKVAKAEVPGLYKALMDGRIDGSTYNGGECACLVGTIAKIRNEEYADLSIKLSPDSQRPAEKWFLAIRRGDTPDSNAVSGITADWVREWAKDNSVKLPVREVVWKDSA